MTNTQLDTEIRQKRAELAQVRAELAELQHELDAFAGEYDRVVGSAEAQLDTIRQQIEALQNEDLFADWSLDSEPTDASDDEYESVEAQFRRAMDPNAAPRRKAISFQPAQDDLKTLYRKLARKFHPDTTTDPAEKARLTVLMAQINAAYREKNIEELRRFADEHSEKSAPLPDLAREIKPIPDLREVSRQLDEEIALAKSLRASLLTSSLMVLKIECSLARSRGRDLLGERAAKVYADLESAIAELQVLRR
jgi:hypothetical protein